MNAETIPTLLGGVTGAWLRTVLVLHLHPSVPPNYDRVTAKTFLPYNRHHIKSANVTKGKQANDTYRIQHQRTKTHAKHRTLDSEPVCSSLSQHRIR